MNPHSWTCEQPDNACSPGRRRPCGGKGSPYSNSSSSTWLVGLRRVTERKYGGGRASARPDDRPVAKGTLCAQEHGFNLHGATRVAANDKPGRITLCRYILRPPLANDRLHVQPDGSVRLDFKKPWSNGTASVELDPLALIARLAALVPPPRRHTVRYSGVLSSHSASRSQVVPTPVTAPLAGQDKPGQDKPKKTSRYIRWSDLLRRVFGIETICQKCQAPLRLIALIKTEDIARKILTAMHLPTEVPELHPARPPPRAAGDGEDWLN